MKFCPSCKSQIADYSLKKFCPHCGLLLGHPAGKGLGIVAIGGFAIAFLFFGVLGILALFTPSSADIAQRHREEVKAEAQKPVVAIVKKPFVLPEPTPTVMRTTPEPSRSLDLGGIGRLNCGGSIPVMLGTTKDAVDEVQHSLNARDREGLREMVMRGRAFIVPSDTRAKLIDRGFFSARVRVMEGASAGQAGWIPSEYIK